LPVYQAWAHTVPHEVGHLQTAGKQLGVSRTGRSLLTG
jgi:hypothetical protein